MVKTIVLPITFVLLYSILTTAQFYGNCETGKYFQRDVGGKRALLDGDLQEAEHMLRTILVRLADGEGPFYRVATVFGASEHVSTGLLRSLNAELVDFNGLSHNCQVDIWSRPWLAEGTEVTIRCECLKTLVRQVTEPLQF